MGPAARAKKGSLRMVIKENGRLLLEGNKLFYDKNTWEWQFLYGEDIFLMDLLIKFKAILLASLRKDK